MNNELINKLDSTWNPSSYDKIFSYIDSFSNFIEYLDWLNSHNDFNVLYHKWSSINFNWRFIQYYLDHNCYPYRICPYCGLVLHPKHFTSHLWKYHEVDRLSYVLKLNNLTEVPKCANPECSNKVNYNVRSTWTFAHTCSPHCKSKALVYEGKHHFLGDNLELDIDGKSILHKNAVNSQLSSGTHNWLSQNLVYDSNGKSVHHSNIQYKIHELGYGNMQYWDYDKIKIYGYTKEQVEEHNRQFELKLCNSSKRLIKLMHHSGRTWTSPVEEYLGELLSKLNIRYISQYEVETSLTTRLLDYYLPDYNIGLECDGMFKSDEEISTRKHEIQESTGIVIKNIRSYRIKYVYSNNINKLKEDIEYNEYPLINLNYFRFN